MGFIPFSIIDFIDILLVTTLMFGIYRATKGTNAQYILTGIIFVYLTWVIVKALNMELLSGILGQIISVGVIALFIIFQPEIRRFLQIIGMRQKELGFITRIFSQPHKEDLDTAPIVAACPRHGRDEDRRAHRHRAAQRPDPYNRRRHSSERDGFTVASQEHIFQECSAARRAVVINDNRIVAAKCILPVTQSDVPKSYGTRHRAAIGLSEISDAIIIVVSEETGGISIAHNGQLRRDIDPNRLAQAINRYINANTRKSEKENA